MQNKYLTCGECRDTKTTQMDVEDDSIHLLGYRSSSPKHNGRRRRSKYSTSREDFDGENGFRMHLSDSELGQKKREHDMERSTVFSDDSLPSVRAHLATSQMHSRSHGRGQVESSMNENQPLLGTLQQEEPAKLNGETATGFVEPLTQTPENDTGNETEPNNVKYNSISTRLLTKRRNRRDRLLVW